MRRRVGVGFVVVIVVVAAALLVWRCNRVTGRGAPQGTSVAPGATWRASGSAARAHSPVPRPPASASLAGTITDAATRAPIAGAQVCADGWSTELASELLREPVCADSDAAGRYLISNLLAATYFVHASARTYRPELHHPDGDPRKRFLVLAAAEHRTGVDVAMQGGGVEITGTVADLTGGPIAHARVRGGGGTLSSRPRAGTETDDRGRFSLWVAPGAVAVAASADGYAPQTTSGRAPGTFELLLVPEASFAGTVVDGATGKPVEGAHVALSGERTLLLDDSTTFTGPDGSFRVGGLAPGRYTATARTEHGYGRTEGSLLVGLGQHLGGVVVKLSPAVRVEGKLIIAATRQPCPDGDVRLEDEARHHRLQLRETAGGIHIIDGVLPGTYSIQAECRDFVSRDSYPPVAITDKAVTGLVWEVDAGGTLRGKVTTRSGGPVGGARVSSRPPGERTVDWRTEWTEADGRYELRGLRPGTHRVEVYTQQALTPAGGGFAIEIASGAVVERDLVLDDSGTIKGAVVDPDGKPVGGMYIAARLASARPSPGFSDCKSDDAGAFACESLAPGDYRVTAQAVRFAPPNPSSDARAGEAVTVRANQASTVTLVVEAQSGAIRGTVVDDHGQPVDDAFVSAARESPALGGRGSSIIETRASWATRPNLTAADGTFQVPKLAAGSYTVRAYRRGGGEAIAEHVAVGSTVQLQITAPASLEGTARRAGKPVSSIAVSVRNPQTWFSREDQFYETGGHYIVRDLPRGHLQVTVETEGGRKQLELDLAEGEHRTVDVELEDLVTLTGRVVEQGTTTPVAGVRILVDSGGGPRRAPRFDDGLSMSDEHGRFTIHDVSRGKARIMGFPPGGASSGFLRVERTIEGAGTVDVGDLELEKRPR